MQTRKLTEAQTRMLRAVSRDGYIRNRRGTGQCRGFLSREGLIERVGDSIPAIWRLTITGTDALRDGRFFWSD